jgi:uncharacterized membrane protein YraQ (UPF0718 family)
VTGLFGCYILIGVGIGALINNWIPETTTTALLGQDKWWSALVATVGGHVLG